MSIEALITSLIAALEANTASNLQGKTADTAADAGAKTTTSKTAGAKGAVKTTGTKTTKVTPKHSKQETTDAIVSVKETLGAPAAKALLSDHGFAKLADITEDKFDALFDAATDLLPQEEPAAEEPTDDEI